MSPLFRFTDTANRLNLLDLRRIVMITWQSEGDYADIHMDPAELSLQVHDSIADKIAEAWRRHAGGGCE